MLSTATADYAYTIENSTPDFVLLPEILVRLGEAYALMPELAKAIQTYERAIEIKPDYWPAYDRMATAYTQVRLPDRALDTLRNGLRALPGQPELLRQYKQLGGKLDDVARPPSGPSAASGVSDAVRLNQLALQCPPARQQVPHALRPRAAHATSRACTVWPHGVPVAVGILAPPASLGLHQRFSELVPKRELWVRHAQGLIA